MMEYLCFKQWFCIIRKNEIKNNDKFDAVESTATQYHNNALMPHQIDLKKKNSFHFDFDFFSRCSKSNLQSDLSKQKRRQLEELETSLYTMAEVRRQKFKILC